MEAAGKLGWWNQHSGMVVYEQVDRAKEAELRGVIVKVGYPLVQEKFLRAGFKVGAEAYVYPGRAGEEGKVLATSIARGASYVVINAEVEWENQGRQTMERLIASIRVSQPTVELYASVDTRGNRTRLPYQKVLSENIVAWMPMIYPLAFKPSSPAGFVERAFMDSLDTGQQFNGLPILPTIQTYGGIGHAAVRRQIAECERRELEGYQAYTIGHATDDEWAVFVGAQRVPQEEDMSWLDEPVRNYGGDLVEFEILQGDWTTRMASLSRKEWITYTALKWIVGAHSHTIPPMVIK